MSRQHVNDIDAIRNLRALYGDLIDRVVNSRQADDADRIAELFTHDAVLEFRSNLGRHEGRDAIVRFFVEDLPAATEWMWHSFHSPIITIDGNTAKGRWTLYALSVAKEAPSAPPKPTYGRYIDRYANMGDGWRIQHQTFLDETRNTDG